MSDRVSVIYTTNKRFEETMKVEYYEDLTDAINYIRDNWIEIVHDKKFEVYADGEGCDVVIVEEAFQSIRFISKDSGKLEKAINKSKKIFFNKETLIS